MHASAHRGNAHTDSVNCGSTCTDGDVDDVIWRKKSDFQRQIIKKIRLFAIDFVTLCIVAMRADRLRF